MRLDQYDRLQALQERLTDTVLQEADPDRWPGEGKELAALTREERGDRYWCKRNAAATLSIIMKVHTLLGATHARGVARPNETDDEVDLEQEVRQAEKEAAAILEKMQKRARARQ
ncbi:MAG: hypothetical protein IT518_20280 [Burkholderiales bacterium]|nr:hypothetical protein [Burkholderiales bacterium]